METLENTQETTEIVEAPIIEQAVNTENAEPNTEVETKPEKTFTQAELDSIIAKRIERERETTSRKASEEARNAVIAEENIIWNGKQLTTYAEYKEMQKEQVLRKQYENQDLPEEVLNEIIEGKRFREQYESKAAEMERLAKEKTDAESFLQAYPDVKAEDIPKEVWAEVDKGKSLVDAYARHENQILREQLAEAKKAKEIEALNEQNASTSTGSVTGQGEAPKAAFYTQKQVLAMSNEETNRNWSAIQQSMKNPKFYD